MKKKISEVLSKYNQNNGYTIEHAERELLNLFSVNNSFVSEYVEHCILCRENGLPMLDWYSYQKQFCC